VQELGSNTMRKYPTLEDHNMEAATKEGCNMEGRTPGTACCIEPLAFATHLTWPWAAIGLTRQKRQV
jgi:hypothetical protein